MMKKLFIIFFSIANLLLADLNEDLTSAIENNNYNSVLTLLKKGAKVNPTEEYWDKKPIFYAVDTAGSQNLDKEESIKYIETKVKIIDLLISKGANVNEVYNDGGRYSDDIKLYDSIINSKIAEYVAKKGVKFSSLLEAYVARIENSKVEEILKKSSKESKEAAFKIAVKFGYKDIANLFLVDGVVDKNKALFVSVNYNQYDITELLLLAKANPNIEDYYKEVELKCRPIDIVLIKDNKTIFDLLRKYGAEY